MNIDRSALPHTFGPWFARFDELTEVQRLAIPHILAGGDVLMCSATATGKTEAFAAPAAELVLQHKQSGVSTLVIAPTRALTNDLKRRLEAPMALVGVSLGRYTGEHKEKVAGQMPSVVVATPEAVDSLLARRPQVLAGTRQVVLDEIHVLDNTPRGDQLRILLQRLEGVTGTRPQRIAASATVDQPQELGRRYLKDPEVVVVPGLRKILGRAFHGASPDQMAGHLEDLAGHGFKKILVFCRSRNQVETYSAKLHGKTRFGDEIFAHHGSLAKKLRERTERLFQHAPAAVCFATLTLEMGIDIGTVDYVLLAGVPADISSLLQRIGRGGRRGDTTRCGYAVEDAGEALLFRTMFLLGKQGLLCSRPYGFRPSILVQQAMVLACSQTFVQKSDLEAALPPELLEELGPGACESILRCMVDADLLERSGRDRYVPGEIAEERYARGNLHSNIDDVPGVDVIDRMTGDIVGRVTSLDSGHIEIGGRDRKIIKASDDRVLTDAAPGASPARFRPSASPSVSFTLARAVVESIGVSEGCLGVVAEAGTTILLHGLGTVGALFLVDAWKRHSVGGRVSAFSPYTLSITGAWPSADQTDQLFELLPEELDHFLRQRLAGLAKLVQVGPWQRVVPEALMLDSVQRSCGLDEVYSFLEGARLQPIGTSDPETRAAILEL
jgi:ATP-dependent Lhr-like helicase